MVVDMSRARKRVRAERKKKAEEASLFALPLRSFYGARDWLKFELFYE